MWWRASFLVSGLVSLSAPAWAHIDLVFPPPRLAGTEGRNALKIGPCGQAMGQNGRTQTVTEFTPGETITVQVSEYIPHPGYYRVAFDVDGDDDFPIRADMDSLDSANDDSETVHPVGDVILLYDFDKNDNIEVTLPNVECDNCTLQVVQFMYDKIGNSLDDEYYFQCADIRLVGDVATTDEASDSDDATTDDATTDDVTADVSDAGAADDTMTDEGTAPVDSTPVAEPTVDPSPPIPSSTPSSTPTQPGGISAPSVPSTTLPTASSAPQPSTPAPSTAPSPTGSPTFSENPLSPAPGAVTTSAPVGSAPGGSSAADDGTGCSVPASSSSLSRSLYGLLAFAAALAWRRRIRHS